MLSSLEYKHINFSVEHFDEKKYAVCRIDEYLHSVSNEILKIQLNSDSVDRLVKLLLNASRQNKDVMIMGDGSDTHLISHANADFVKMNRIKTVCMGTPEITAFGNDFEYPYNFTRWLEKRGFCSGSILIGIQFDKPSPLLMEAFFYNRKNNGVNVLISNSTGTCHNIDVLIPVYSRNVLIACDILQLIFHFVSSNIAYKTNSDYPDKGARTLKDYCGLLLESLKSSSCSSAILAEISILLKGKIKTGRTLFTFGNGGSAAISAYFADGLRAAYKGRPKDARNIIDVTSFNSDIVSSLYSGVYKSVFTRIIKSLGVEEDDILMGISSSGSSDNIIHPFSEIPDVNRVGILGFEDGGAIGQSGMAQIAFIVPDKGGFKSYQRAEDGQRIALSSILNTF
jgi:phosphoheptose isomerase